MIFFLKRPSKQKTEMENRRRCQPPSVLRDLCVLCAKIFRPKLDKVFSHKEHEGDTYFARSTHHSEPSLFSIKNKTQKAALRTLILVFSALQSEPQMDTDE